MQHISESFSACHTPSVTTRVVSPKLLLTGYQSVVANWQFISEGTGCTKDVQTNNNKKCAILWVLIIIRSRNKWRGREANPKN